MIVPASEEGVRTLRKLVGNLNESGESIAGCAKELISSMQSCEQGFGSYAQDIKSIVDDISSDTLELKNALGSLAEQLEKQIKTIEDIIDIMEAPSISIGQTIAATGIVATGLLLNGMFPQLGPDREELQKDLFPSPVAPFVHQVWEFAQDHNELMDKVDQGKQAAEAVQWSEQIKASDEPNNE